MAVVKPLKGCVRRKILCVNMGRTSRQVFDVQTIHLNVYYEFITRTDHLGVHQIAFRKKFFRIFLKSQGGESV